MKTLSQLECRCITCNSPNCKEKNVSFWNKYTAEMVKGVECFCSEECKTKYYAQYDQDDSWLEVGSKEYNEFILLAETAGRS